MLWRAAALTPALGVGLWQFGASAILVIAGAVGGALVTEALVGRLAQRPFSLLDGHALFVGLLLAAMLPPAAPWWMAALGAALGIGVAKIPFGPLGSHPLPPALIGLLALTLSWPAAMSRFSTPRSAPAALHAAEVAPPESPIVAVRADASDALEYAPGRLFLGDQAGPLGAVSPLALLVGALVLLVSGVARPHGMIGFLAGVGLTAAVAHGVAPGSAPPTFLHLFAGLTCFAAVFLVTEPVTTPVAPTGLLLWAFAAGVLAVILRQLGGHDDGVPWAVAILSIATPLFDRLRPRPFGKGARDA